MLINKDFQTWLLIGWQLNWNFLVIQVPGSKYCQTSNIKRTLVDKELVDHSDVVGASPVGTAPTTSSFSS